MKKRPSEQSRDSRYNYYRQNTQPTEIRYITRQLSEEHESNSRTNRRADSKIGSYSYVPQAKSTPKHYLTGEDNYEKPSLPYYVVPVLYVPQKVLSSENIRPAVQQNPAASFTIRNQKLEENIAPLDVDNIPCIPCETKKKMLQKENSYNEQILLDDAGLNQAYAGYVNNSYAKSSTSFLDDLQYDGDNPDYDERRFCPNYFDYCGKMTTHKRNYPVRKCNPQVYRQFLQQQKRFGNYRQPERPSAPKPTVQLRWNSDCECYEIDESLPDKVEPPGREMATTTYDLRACSRNDKCVEVTICDDKHYCKKGKVCEDSRPEKINHKRSIDQQDYSSEKRSIDLQDYSSFKPYEDIKRFSSYSQTAPQPVHLPTRSSTLSCEKASGAVTKVASLFGVSMDCESASHERSPRKKSGKLGEQTDESHEEHFIAEPIDTQFKDGTVLSVVKKTKSPKASQTNFEPTTYSTYIKNEPLRDSKSTQTVDAMTTTLATGTQTDRNMSLFATVPPPYMQQIREGVSHAVKQQRFRDTSTSPTRIRKPQSPNRPYAGDTKRISALKQMEVVQKYSENNQYGATYPSKLPKSRKKKIRAPLASV